VEFGSLEALRLESQGDLFFDVVLSDSKVRPSLNDVMGCVGIFG